MELLYNYIPSLRRKRVRASPDTPLVRPWPQLSRDASIHLLQVILCYSPLDTFVALLSAFPILCRDVTLVSDTEAQLAPGVKAIHAQDLDLNPSYDKKPLVVFIFQNVEEQLGQPSVLFKLLHRHSRYFTPGAFISIEAPNIQCFQLGMVDYFVRRRGAILLPPVIRTNRSRLQSYQCLREVLAYNHFQTAPSISPLQRTLVHIPNGQMYAFDLSNDGGSSTTDDRLNTRYCIDVVDNEVDLERLPAASTMTELRTHFSRCCTDNQCHPNKIFLSRHGTLLERICVTFRGWDAPDISHRIGRAADTDWSAPRDRSLALVNLDWSLQNFHGSSCPHYATHWELTDPTEKNILHGPMEFTDWYVEFFYIGVPIETVLKSSFMSAHTLIWKRVTRVDPLNPGAVSSFTTDNGSQMIQDFLNPHFKTRTHDYHTIVDHTTTVKVDVLCLHTLKIWSHLNELEPLPRFLTACLDTLVLVALNNSVIGWDVNRLISSFHDPEYRPQIFKKALIGVLGDVDSASQSVVLKWDQYSIISRSLLDLTLIGYILDKFCGAKTDINNTDRFERLETLSIDVTNLPLTIGKQGQEILDIVVSPCTFPAIKHLDLSGAPIRPVPGVMRSTELCVPKTCVSVTASTTLASQLLIINRKMMDVGQDHVVRGSRWRVKWTRCGEGEFAYKETFRLPIDPDIVEMSEYSS